MRRARRTFVGLVAALAALLLLSCASTAGATRTFFAAYPIAGSPMQERPAAIKVGSGTTWSSLRWHGWGTQQATADGELLDHPGIPGGLDAPGTVTLSRPVRCGPFRVYTRMLGRLDDGGDDYGATAPIAFRPRSCKVQFPQNLAQTLPEDPIGGMAFAPRPRRIALTLDSGLARLAWRGWGQPRAVARGVAQRLSYCAGGTRRCPRHARVRVTARRLGWCGGYLAYRRIDFPGVRRVLSERTRDLGTVCG